MALFAASIEYHHAMIMMVQATIQDKVPRYRLPYRIKYHHDGTVYKATL